MPQKQYVTHGLSTFDKKKFDEDPPELKLS